MKSDIDALMQEKNLDALVVVGAAEHNPPMYYFTGGGHVSAAVLVKKRGEEPILFYNDMERDEAAKTGLQTKSLSAYPFQELMKEAGGDLSLVSAIRFQRILTELGLTKGRVGVYGHVEISGIFAVLTRLQRLMPDVELVGENGMNSIFSRAMETKDERDVERIRQMGKITTEVVRRTAEYLTSSDVRADEVLLKEDGSPLSVGDVHSKIRLWVAELGAELPEGFIFSIGRDAGVPHSIGNPDRLDASRPDHRLRHLSCRARRRIFLRFHAHLESRLCHPRSRRTLRAGAGNLQPSAGKFRPERIVQGLPAHDL